MSRSSTNIRVDVEVYPGTGWQALHLPKTLAEYRELWAVIERLRQRKEFEAWKAAMRMWGSADSFFRLIFIDSAGQAAWNRWRHERHFWTTAHLECCREVQFSTEPWVLIAYRGMGKSTIVTKNDNIGQKLSSCRSGDISWGNADHASVIFSASRQYATKHLRAISDELRGNDLYKTLWDDRFWQDIDDDSQNWSLTTGLTIKRSSSRPEASFSAEAFVGRLPVGSHPDTKYYDDIEEETAVSSEEAMSNIEEKFVSSKNLRSSAASLDRHLGTYYHPNGMMMKLQREFGYRRLLFQGEDLSRRPPKEVAGPLGGAPVNGMTRDELFDRINEKGGIKRAKARRDHAMQIGCDPLAGEDGRFESSAISYYDDEPVALAREERMAVVICMDPSMGKEDPTWIWVWGLTRSRRLYWLDSERRRMAPRARTRAMFEVCARWRLIADVAELRIEQYGQSEAATSQESYHKEVGLDIPIRVSCDSQHGKEERIYSRWEPLASDGRLYFPRSMRRVDEDGELVDLVSYFITNEWSLFPKPMTDDGLDAGGLIADEKAGKIPWPSGLRREEQSRHDYDGGETWMSGGIC